MLEVRFPLDIEFGAVGGPTFNTTVNAGFNGMEARNKNWSAPLGRWQFSLYQKDQTEFDKVLSFFLVAGGKWRTFRLHDPKDYKALGQTCGGAVDGANKNFQLRKTFTVGSDSYIRTITKPVTTSVKEYDGTTCDNTVKVYDNGALKTLTTHYTIDHTTGIVSFGTAPVAGHVITADFEYDFKVRFDSDECKGMVEESAPGERRMTWSSVALVEVRGV